MALKHVCLLLIAVSQCICFRHVGADDGNITVRGRNASLVFRYKTDRHLDISDEDQHATSIARTHEHIIPLPLKQHDQDNDTFRGEPCTDNERRSTKCIVGQGECFVYVIGYQRKPSCHCSRRYAGTRCEELNWDMLYPSTEHAVYSGIVLIVVVGIVVAVVHIVIIILCYRRRNRVNRDRLLNGNALGPDRHDHVIADLQVNWNRKCYPDASQPPRPQGMELTTPSTV